MPRKSTGRIRTEAIMTVDDQTLSVPDIQVGLLATQRPVAVYVDDYYWSCQVCGWLGTGLSSIDAAQAEAADHFRAEHEPREVYMVRRDQRPTGGVESDE